MWLQRAPGQHDYLNPQLFSRLLVCRLSPPIIKSRRAEMAVPQHLLNNAQVNTTLE
jgi:hypothetical protein